RVIVKEASIERDLVSSSGTSYVRLAVTDHTRPLDDTVDRFILAVRGLPQNAWAHFHCEAGLGRTTTFLVLYDMLRNATRVSLEDLVLRQKLLGYGYDVLQPVEAGNWKAPYIDDRIAFVRAFYNYARANPNGRPQLWSEWLTSIGLSEVLSLFPDKHTFRGADESQWPLTSGEYDLKLMFDDGFTELAATKLKSHTVKLT